MKSTKNEFSNHIYVLILCGGFGPKLWPLSRTNKPKPFLPLFGKKSLLQKTYDRAKLLTSEKRIWISTTENLAPLVRSQLPGVSHLSLEPIRRNTAWAHALAAVQILHQDPEAIIINLASDHVVNDLPKFESTMLKAAKTAVTTSKIISVGIPPTSPHTGYEYIRIGKKLLSGAFTVKKFILRPSDPVSAQKLIDTKGTYWNANMYVWQGKVLLKTMKEISPRLFRGIIQIEKVLGTDNESQVIRRIFQMAQPLQIDKLLIPHPGKMLMLPAAFGWTDVGNWNEITKIFPPDENSNSLLLNFPRQLVCINTKNSLFISRTKRIIATVGISDFVVIDTPDALLICPKSQAQNVKKVVDELIAMKGTKYI